MREDSYEKIFDEAQRVLVVMAHPDDAEILCGGLCLRLAQDKKKVRLVVMTNGGKGFQDREDITEEEFGKLRTVEQEQGAALLGIPKEENFNLQLADGEVENSLANVEKIVFHIRDFKPDVIICHNVDDAIVKFSEETHWVNHRDHRHAGIVTMDAAYPYSRDRGFFPEHFITEPHIKPHKVTKLLFADVYQHPDTVFFDVTDFVAHKTEALKQHKNAIAEDHVEGYIEDFKHDDGRYYESMRYVEIY